jgi:carboxylesterase type B
VDVINYYPSPDTPGSPYITQTDRVIQYLDDTNFLCNYRYLNNAFKGKTYSMQYSVGPALHGDDLTAVFYNGTGAPSLTLDTLYKDYQSYLDSLTTTGNPNTHRLITGVPSTINWPITIGQQSEQLANVLNVTDTGFTLISDSESLKSRCDFFLNVQAAITLAGGYVPPGGLFPTTLE